MRNMNNYVKLVTTFRLMNAAQLKSKFDQIEGDNAWDDLFYKINIRSDEQEKHLGLSFDAATSFDNVDKNRYRNVLPYDQNRVTLKRADGSKSAYINASPLKFPHAERGFILSQGPLPNTADDFWQMVHEQGVEIVIMLSKIMEKNFIKCHTYFPSKNNPVELYEFTECELLSEEVKPHYVVRRIRVTIYDSPIKKPSTASKLEDAAYNLAEGIGLKTPLSGTADKSTCEASGSDNKDNCNGGKSRVIYHFQYMTWPDFGVPEHTDHFLEFLEHIRSLEKQLYLKRKAVRSNEKNSNGNDKESQSWPTSDENNDSKPINAETTTENCSNVITRTDLETSNNERPPILCHCSAGIGRTGAFVMIDTILNILERNAKLGKSPSLVTVDDLDSSAEGKQSSTVSNDNNITEIKCSTTISIAPNIDMLEKMISTNSDFTNQSKTENKSLSSEKLSSRETEEEELAVASKKKMRSEESQKPRACGKIICSTSAAQKQTQLTMKSNGKPKSGTSLGLLHTDSTTDDSDLDTRHDVEIETLETLCDVIVFMRKYRMGLIQTPQQLRFCWKAIVDWIDNNEKNVNR